MNKQEALPLHFFIGLFALVCLVAQVVVIPGAASTYASKYPDVAYLQPLYVTALVVALIGLEVALLSAWLLVRAATRERSLTKRSTRWTNIMTSSLIFMAAVLATICVHAGSVEGVGGPGMLFGLLGCLALLPVAFALRSWVMGWLSNDSVYTLAASTSSR